MWMLYCACVYVDVSTHVYTDAQYVCCACACVSVCVHGVCVLHMLYVCVCTHTLGPRGVDGAMKRQEEKEEKVTEERNREDARVKRTDATSSSPTSPRQRPSLVFPGNRSCPHFPCRKLRSGITELVVGPSSKRTTPSARCVSAPRRTPPLPRHRDSSEWSVLSSPVRKGS